MVIYFLQQAVQWITFAFGLVGVFVEVRALIDVVRRKPAEFERADKRTQGFWLALCIGALVVGVLATFGMLGAFFSMFSLMLQIAAVTAASVYLVDVKPALVMYGNGGRPGPRW